MGSRILGPLFATVWLYFYREQNRYEIMLTVIRNLISFIHTWHEEVVKVNDLFQVFFNVLIRTKQRKGLN